MTRIVAHDEGNVVLITLRVCDLREEHATGPRRGDGQHVTRGPRALDKACLSVDWTRELRHASQRTDVL